MEQLLSPSGMQGRVQALDTMQQRVTLGIFCKEGP